MAVGSKRQFCFVEKRGLEGDLSVQKYVESDNDGSELVGARRVEVEEAFEIFFIEIGSDVRGG